MEPNRVNCTCPNCDTKRYEVGSSNYYSQGWPHYQLGDHNDIQLNVDQTILACVNNVALTLFFDVGK